MKIAELKAHIDQLSADNDAVVVRNQELSAQLESLEKNNSELQAKQQESADELARLQAEKSRLEVESQAKLADVESLKNQLASVTNEKCDIQEANQKLVSEINMLNVHLEDNVSVVTAASTFVAPSSSQQTSNWGSLMETTIQGASTAPESQDSVHLTSQNEKLREENRNLQASLDELATGNRQLEKENEELSVAVRELTSEKDALLAELAASHSAETVDSKLRELKQQLEVRHYGIVTSEISSISDEIGRAHV